MATTTMTIRMDAALKESAEELCREMGMNLTTAFNIFTRAMVRERGIPFAVRGNVSLYDEPNLSHILAAKKEFESGGGAVHELVREP